MQGFMKTVGLSKPWWQLIGIICIIGSGAILALIGAGIVFLYDHLVWQESTINEVHVPWVPARDG